VIVAAGNQGTLGSTAITCHPWVIPVVGYDLQGRPMNHSNLGSSIGRRGLGAPGDRITSIGANGKPLTLRKKDQRKRKKKKEKKKGSRRKKGQTPI
jgi:hypothetical protein